MGKFDNSWFIIPARRGSKGVPFKNRFLIEYVVDSIPDDLKEKIIISTDDEYIVERMLERNIEVLERKSELATDEADVKCVVEDVITQYKIKDEDYIFMLYTVWPERTFGMIEKIFDIFLGEKVDSLLCSTEVKTHPYMTFYLKDDNKGEPVVKHDFYRRQDYPECFVINHLVTIFKSGTIRYLNTQFYNDKTYFHPVDELINIDSRVDLEEFNLKYKKEISYE